MAKSGFLERQKIERQVCMDIGAVFGRQQIIDMISLVLNDPQIMGKDVFGKERLTKIISGIDDYLDKYYLAWRKHDEADYYRVKLDEALKKIYGEEMHDSFMQRYDFMKEYDYKKGKWV